MMQLQSANNDQQYMQFAQAKYDELINELQKKQKRASEEVDVDIKAHIDELDKKQLKSSGWLTEPLDNVEHDFVSDLLNRYLQDLEKRLEFQSSEEAGYCKNLRKVVELDTIELEINN